MSVFGLSYTKIERRLGQRGRSETLNHIGLVPDETIKRLLVYVVLSLDPV